ncbi:hypothetical protein BG58_10585 [Caballeronia jiangsuensis]|nr:hypothetical protein BG58_10585 [Caballeronia jiangsuensis]
MGMFYRSVRVCGKQAGMKVRLFGVLYAANPEFPAFWLEGESLREWKSGLSAGLTFGIARRSQDSSMFVTEVSVFRS